MTTTVRPCSGRRSSQASSSRRRRDLADHDQRRRLDRLALDRRRDRPEGRGDGPLSRPGAAFDRRRGLLGIATAGDQRRRVLAQPFDAHVEDERAGEAASAGQSSAVSALLGILVAGDEGDGGGVVAVGHRDAGVGGGGDAGGDAGDDLERDAGRRAALRASSPPRPKTNGSPPLSRTTLLPAFAALDQPSPISSCGTVGTPGCLPT